MTETCSAVSRSTRDCSVCHAVKHLYFRDLADLGYSEEVKAIAAGYGITDPQPNDQPDGAGGRGGLSPYSRPSRMIRRRGRRATAPFRRIYR
jgi:cytochrome c1